MTLEIEPERQCRVCHHKKPISEFSGGKRRVCNACRSDQEAARRQTSEHRLGERVRSAERRKTEAVRNYHKTYAYKSKLKKYGLTWDDYQRMIATQEGRCLICQREARLYVDHDHETTKVRGLLCGSCNSGIGYMGDSIANVRRALEYLLSPPGVPVEVPST